MNNYLQTIHSQISKEYETLRLQNAQKHKQIVEKIYDHIPDLRSIDEALKDIGFGICDDVLKGKVSAAAAVEKMHADSDRLTERKSSLLAKAGISPDILKEIYTCKNCMDKGHINGQRCKCYNEKFYAVLRKMSNVCASTNNTFKQYNLDLYSKEVGSRGISPYDNAAANLSLAKNFARGDCIGEHLLLYGSTGLGKTFTSDCIANEYIKKGRTVLYMSAPKLFGMFEDYKFGRDTSDSTKMMIDFVGKAELLIIDDLGTEFRSSYTDSILFDIVNSRINEQKSMIISTNLTTQQITDTYSGRISSRILGMFKNVMFFGDDIRMKARQ